MDDACSAISTANMELAYWPYAVSDVAYKHNVLLHTTAGKRPLTDWSTKPEKLPPLHMFGQIGRINNLPVAFKIQPRWHLARHLGNKSTKMYLFTKRNFGKSTGDGFPPREKTQRPHIKLRVCLCSLQNKIFINSRHCKARNISDLPIKLPGRGTVGQGS